MTDRGAAATRSPRGSWAGAASWTSCWPPCRRAATSSSKARRARRSRRCCGRSPASWGVPFVLVEGNAELTPARLVGHHNPARVLREDYSADNFVPGPLVAAMQDGGFLYIEELNRAPEDTLNVLLAAMAEREVAVPRVGMITALPTFRVLGVDEPVRQRRHRADLRLRLRPVVPARRRLPGRGRGAGHRRGPHRQRRRRRSSPTPWRSPGPPAATPSCGGAPACAAPSTSSRSRWSSPSWVATPATGHRLVLDAALLALSGRIGVDETSDATPEEVITRDLGGPFFLAPRRAAPGRHRVERRQRRPAARLRDPPAGPGPAAPPTQANSRRHPRCSSPERAPRSCRRRRRPAGRPGRRRAGRRPGRARHRPARRAARHRRAAGGPGAGPRGRGDGPADRAAARPAPPIPRAPRRARRRTARLRALPATAPTTSTSTAPSRCSPSGPCPRTPTSSCASGCAPAATSCSWWTCPARCAGRRCGSRPRRWRPCRPRRSPAATGSRSWRSGPTPPCSRPSTRTSPPGGCWTSCCASRRAG